MLYGLTLIFHLGSCVVFVLSLFYIIATLNRCMSGHR